MSWKDKYTEPEQALRLGARRLTLKDAPNDFWMAVTDAGEFSGIDRHGRTYGYDYIAGPIDELGNEVWSIALNKSSGRFIIAKGLDEKTIVGHKVRVQKDSFVDFEGQLIKFFRIVSIKEGGKK